MTDPVILFREAMAATFGLLDFLPTPDGEIHRFHVPGDRTGSRNGWYALHLDGLPVGVFGSWKLDHSTLWSSRQAIDYREDEQLRQRVEQIKRKCEAGRIKRQQEAAAEARLLWFEAGPADADHPYLARKGCKPHNLRQSGAVLLVPLYLGRQLVNLQRIYPDGAKRFMPGGRVKGCYSALGQLEEGQRVYVCEGWATGATIHEHAGAAAACAMNAGNLLEVGNYLRLTYPNNPLIIAGDDDRQTDGNPGRTAAERAAIELGCDVVFPPWNGAEPLGLTDFNDLRQWREANL